jgi:hypothetical protein
MSQSQPPLQSYPSQSPYGQQLYPSPTPPQKIRPSLWWLAGSIGVGVLGILIGVVLCVLGLGELFGEHYYSCEVPGTYELELTRTGRYTVLPTGDLLPDGVRFELTHAHTGEPIPLKRCDLGDLLGDEEMADEDNVEWMEFDLQQAGTVEFAAEPQGDGWAAHETLDVSYGSFGKFMRYFMVGLGIAAGGFLVGLAGVVIVLSKRASFRTRQRLMTQPL